MGQLLKRKFYKVFTFWAKMFKMWPNFNQKFLSCGLRNQNFTNCWNWNQKATSCQISNQNSRNVTDFETKSTTCQISNQKLYKLSVIKSKCPPCLRFCEGGFSNDFKLDRFFYNMSEFESWILQGVRFWSKKSTMWHILYLKIHNGSRF